MGAHRFFFSFTDMVLCGPGPVYRYKDGAMIGQKRLRVFHEEDDVIFPLVDLPMELELATSYFVPCIKIAFFCITDIGSFRNPKRTFCVYLRELKINVISAGNCTSEATISHFRWR
ncbi:unnamed protein product [Amoebophrya sp. A25]|nr:unnamed protein product [Amoebophrya sp. A25]|eukprot:GSA25T00014362001.1